MKNLKTAPRIFGTDGVRGRANVYPMVVEVALALGRAMGKVFKRTHDGKHRVIIGKDTRLSCYMFENALISGLCSMGVDTFVLGPFPTPGVAFITRAYRADAGIVISASHNPYYDNGIKFFSSEGFKFPDAWERDLESLIHTPNFEEDLPKDCDIGKNAKINDADGRYIEFIKATFPKKRSLKNVKIVLDCANGAAYKIAPLVFRELDAEVFVYGCQPNGLNINEKCGSLYPKNLQRSVVAHEADIGIALDGDADRVLLVDEKGSLIDGDVILAICAKNMKERSLLSNNKVVSTVMCNLGVINTLKNWGIELIQAQVGDRYVIQEMLENEAILGGEQSGHLIFLEQNTTGDGLVSALQVLRIMCEKQCKLSELAAAVELYPQFRVDLKVTSKPSLETLKSVTEVIDAVKTSLGNSGRVLVRYSGTEDICRVMVEGPTQSSVQRFSRQIAKVIQEQIGQ
ncbi:MAG: phosphoglucosamine mutase [Parachlamydiaceae bacterium]|nr:phosphoglucosamine mutase [Parachlamydiaceae bacterium]